MKLPKLSLRDLFWLMLVCALAVGWWVDRSQLATPIDLESEYIRGASDESARWFQVVEKNAGLDDTTKRTIRREYLKMPGSGLPRPTP